MGGFGYSLLSIVKEEVTGEMIMKEQVYFSIDDIRKLWEDIYKNNYGLSWFQSFEWNKALENAFRSRKVRYHNCQLKYIVFEDRFIAPVVINKKEKKIEFLGVRESSDYLSFIYDSSASDEELIAWICNLVKKFPDFQFSFDRINERNRFKDILNSLIEVKTFHGTVQQSQCVVVSTMQNTDSYLQSLSKSVRQNYRTARNRMKKDGLSYEVKMETSKMLNNQQKELYELYCARRADCDNSNNKISKLITALKSLAKNILREKEVDVLSEYASKTAVFCSQIYINGQLAAFCEGNINNNNECISIARVATKAAFYKYSPGQVMLIEIIELLKSEIKYFDLTRGTEDYKFKLGGTIHHNYNFRLY